MGQISTSAFTAYVPTQASAIQAGPLALYTVAVGSIDPTQVNEGFVEVGKKASAYDLQTAAQLAATLPTTIEPVVIGPGGQLYVTDGHHTFTALEDSVYGASNPTVYVNVIANYANLTPQQFFAKLQAQNLLLPLDNGVPQTVNTATGAPIPGSLTGLTNDPYRGLEYSILKNKNSKLFTTAANITGAIGTSTPGTDKMTGFYEDFLNAAAYRGADGGLGLPYLSPGDIALASQWALNPASTFTLPNVSGTVTAAQLPGFVLAQSLVEGANGLPATISNATLANGALAANGTFTGLTTIDAGTAANPITIGTPNTGFVMQLGADKGNTVTLNGTNTYTGGTSILAGTLIVTGDAALGATTPTGAAIDPAAVKTSVQAANGIVFNSLSEGAGTLQLGTSAGAGAAFALDRDIAVGGETATINLDGYNTTLNGSLSSLGAANAGLGNATGFSDITFDDSGANRGVVTLATASPNFYGNVIVGGANKPTVRVMSDAALGATSAGGAPAAEIGQVVLNGGTLQQGASFNAADRTVTLSGASTIDTAGFSDTWGALSDTQRVLTITNSSTSTAGAATFASFTVAATATLALVQAAGAAGDTVTFTNGIVRSGGAALILQPTVGTLGGTEKVMSAGASATNVDRIVPAWIVTNNGTAAGPYDFVTYGANGYASATYGGTTVSGATGAQAVKLGAPQTAAGNIAAYALNTNGMAVSGFSTLTIGDGTSADAAGLILATGSSISGGTLAFGGSEGVITTSGTSAAISSTITGTNGLTFSGAGTVTLGSAANLSGLVTVDSGTVTLAGADVFAGDASGVLLNNTKTTPAAAGLSITANNTLAALNSAGNNSTVTISNGAVLTVGDRSNQDSSLSSTITEAGSGVAGALTKDGTGLLDISGGKLTLAKGGSVAVTRGALRTAVGTSANANYVLSNDADLQFAQNGGGQYSGSVTGAGTLHLIGGTLQLTGTANTYTGGTIVETGSTLDLTTANVSSGNADITDAGGLVVFDQATAGTYAGVISDGRELGTGPTLQGSLDKDDSTGANGGDVTLKAVQRYTGATTVEAGTLTLGVADAVSSSSGVTLGRIGGSATTATGVTATLALGASQSVAALNSDAGNATSAVLNGFALTVNQATGTASAFGGAIVDGTAPGALTKAGAGLLTLSGTNTFTGGTTLAAGTLELASRSAAGSGALAFAGAATLQIDASALNGTAYAGAVTGFATGDTLDLRGLAYAADDTATLQGTALTVGDAAGTETLSAFAAPAAPYGFKTASDGQGGTLVTLVAGPPQASSTSVTVAPNASATPIGFSAPTDPSYATAQLAITAGALPKDGTVTLSDGTTAVTAGMSLTAAQLTGLAFTPAAGASGQTSSFTYSVADPAGNTTTGAASLSIGAAPAPAPTPAPTPIPTPTPAPADSVSFDAAVTYERNGVFTLTGHASSAAGVSSVEIKAQVGGVDRDLGSATLAGDGTFTFADPVGATMQNFITATLTDGAGVRTSAAAPISLAAGIAGERYVARQDSYTADGSAYTGSTYFRASGAVGHRTSVAADGSPLSITTEHPNGTSVVDVLASGQTLHSAFFDTFLNHGNPETTFVFDPGHGYDSVRQFRVGGTDHDTVSLLGTDFGNSIADVLRHTTDRAGGAVIADPTTGDTIKLFGVSKAQLVHNQGDVAFHG